MTQTDSPTLLAAALDKLDLAFGPRSDSIGPIDGCDHCVTVKERAALGGPAAAIPDELLSLVLFNWPHTLGSQSDSRLIRRITPRVLRLMSRDALHVDETLVASILVRAGWPGWPHDERKAIGEFCDAWWRCCLIEADAPSAFAALEFLVPLTADVSRWLAAWSVTAGVSADQQLLTALTWWREELCDGDLDLSSSYGLSSFNIAPTVADFLLDQIPRRIPDVLTSDESEILARLALAVDQPGEVTRT